MAALELKLPEDRALLKAAGKLAIAHGQLEYLLQMTIKILAGVTGPEALDATRWWSARELRSGVRRFAKTRNINHVGRLKLDALLERAAQASNERNDLIHRPWAVDKDGKVFSPGDDHTWGPAPDPRALEALARKIWGVAVELNHARLKGFLKEAMDEANGTTGE